MTLLSRQAHNAKCPAGLPAAACERCACSLCGELRRTSPSLHTLLAPAAPKSRILSETENWVVVPTLGPLTAGHVMLVPRSHHLSVLSCPAPLLRECETLLGECAKKLRRRYGRAVLVFEHGSADDGARTCGACVEHAHLHVLPGPESFPHAVTSDSDIWETCASLPALSSRLTGAAYLLVGEAAPSRRIFARRAGGCVPSQLLRRLYAREAGDEKRWDWRRHPRQDLFIETMSDWARP